MVIVSNNPASMKVSSQLSSPDDEPTIEQRLNANIPKSPSFHSGLADLVAENKYVNISKFNFSSDEMNGNNKTTAAEQQSSQQTIFSFTKVHVLL
jgi:hypothetical protein